MKRVIGRGGRKAGRLRRKVDSHQIVDLFDAEAEQKGGHVELVAAEPAFVKGDKDRVTIEIDTAQRGS